MTIKINMDRQSIYTASVFPESEENQGDINRRRVQQQLVDFILDFHVDSAFRYRSDHHARDCRAFHPDI